MRIGHAIAFLGGLAAALAILISWFLIAGKVEKRGQPQNAIVPTDPQVDLSRFEGLMQLAQLSATPEDMDKQALSAILIHSEINGKAPDTEWKPVTHREWKCIVAHELNRPPAYWSCKSIDTFTLHHNMQGWFEDTSIVPEVETALGDWIYTEARSLSEVVENEPTGALYRLTGHRNDDGASCSIKFIGNINWY